MPISINPTQNLPFSSFEYPSKDLKLESHNVPNFIP